MKYVSCMVLALALAGNVAYAGDLKCNPDGNQLELNQCAADKYDAADKQLNDTWKALMKKLKDDKAATAKLRVAQKAWIAFRDAEVEAQFACAEGDIRVCWGSMYPMLYSAALQELTEERTQRLQKYLKEGLSPSLE